MRFGRKTSFTQKIHCAFTWMEFSIKTHSRHASSLEDSWNMPLSREAFKHLGLHNHVGTLGEHKEYDLRIMQFKWFPKKFDVQTCPFCRLGWGLNTSYQHLVTAVKYVFIYRYHGMHIKTQHTMYINQALGAWSWIKFGIRDSHRLVGMATTTISWNTVSFEKKSYIYAIHGCLNIGDHINIILSGP